MLNLPVARKLYGLDHLRALAITLVFIFHYRIFKHPEWINHFGAFGWTGVDLFFVLSGFLIASQLLSTEEVSLRTFFIKRVFRIFPPYFLMVALYFCFPPLRERESLPPLWKFLTFTQNLGLDLKHKGTFSHAWSLCVEEQFYLILPLLVVFLHRFKIGQLAGYLMVLLFAVGFAIRSYLWFHFYVPATEDNWVMWYKWIYYPIFCRLDPLLMGVGLAALRQYIPVVRHKLDANGNWLLLAGLILLAGGWWIDQDENRFNLTIFGFPLIALAYGLMVAGASSPSCFLYTFKSTLTEQLAALSYALYLSHKIVIHVTQEWLEKWGMDAHSNLAFLICTINCIAAAYVMRYAVERPFLKWREKVLLRADHSVPR